MFLNGVASVTVGNTAQVEATWMLPLPSVEFGAASAKWEVLDKSGNVWSFGDADSLAVTSAPIGTDTHVIAVATITIPVDVPADPSGSSYQVRWTLTHGTSTQYAFDSFTVYPRISQGMGPSDGVSMYGNPTELSLLLPTEHPAVKLQVYYQNAPQIEVTAVRSTVAEGYRYSAKVDCDYPNGPSLYPYTCIWNYGPVGQVVMEQASLWLVNPTILQAQSEIRQFLLKAYRDTGIDPDSEFDPATFLLHLQQGAELFNALGYPTNFTMIRASGPIRALWLRCATIAACRAQFLNEGMKAFNFGGQVVNLDVDRSQFWDTLASSLQSELDQAIKPFKENLVRRGILGGDGNVNANSLAYGAVGSIGIALTPVSPIRGASSFLGSRRR